MIKIIMGLVFLIGGLSGELQLRFADSPELMAAIGVVLIVWGVTQVLRRRRADADYHQRIEDQNPTPEFNPPPDNP